MDRTAIVCGRIDWHQAKRAVQKIASTGDIERFTLEDVRDLHDIAEHLQRRMKEANTYAFNRTGRS